MQGLAAGLTLSRRFKLVACLGKGGMGEVWLALDEELGEQVALKILIPELVAEAADEDRFVSLLQEECRKARKLVHPNIVRVYDFHADEAHRFISMQYVDGDNLCSMRSAPFQELLGPGLMICDALEYAHREGIVHRDIKPANILRDHRGSCLLADFGIAAAVSVGATLPGMKGGGSLPSISPQQLAGEAPSVADDIYAFGALFYELLSGYPLFHPDVTPDRVRDEIPPILTVDGSGQGIPAPMSGLIAAMLDKSAARRPAGMGAVRSVLEELKTDYPVTENPDTSGEPPAIRPVSRRTAARPVSQSGDTAPTLRPVTGKPDTGASSRLVYSGLAVLLILVTGVVFILPGLVKERSPVAIERPAIAPPVAPESDNAEQPGAEIQRGLVDETLGELLPLDDRLRKLGIDQWGGSDWAQAQRQVEAGDEAYRSRTYEQALTAYRGALVLMQQLEPRAAQVFAAAVAAGQQALDKGDQAAAIENFELAMSVDGTDEIARKGLQRAMSLNRVLELAAQANEREDAGSMDQARVFYGQALDLDPDWIPAREGLQRTGAAISTDVYETQMASGYRALAAQEYIKARGAFDAALRARPGDTGAREGLAQLASEEKLAQVIDIQNQARRFEEQEDWPAAIGRYEAALAIDGTVSAATAGLTRSQSRRALDLELAKIISRADRLNDEKVWQAANSRLTLAREIQQPGPRLASQISELADLLEIAAIPVPVRFESDNLTEIIIYKVGKLGTFEVRTMDLRPGSYVAVGSRDGYRDVRRDFLVVANGEMPPVVLRCEEPI